MSEQLSCGCGCDVKPVAYAIAALPIDVEAARETRIPTDVGEALAATYRLDEPPATYGAWIREVAETFRNEVGELSGDVLCCTDDTRHRAELANGETEEFACVLDALIYPFVAPSPGQVTSKSPSGGDEITVDISLDDVSVEPSEAVVSIGAPTDAPEGDGDVSEESYYAVCPLINAFPNRDAYDEWAAEQSAATTAVSIETGIGLAIAVADVLTGDES